MHVSNNANPRKAEAVKQISNHMYKVLFVCIPQNLLPTFLAPSGLLQVEDTIQAEEICMMLKGGKLLDVLIIWN